MIKFSLIHASRARPEIALKNARQWLGNSSKENEIEYILSLDLDDAHHYIGIIEELRKLTNLKVVVKENWGAIQGYNAGAQVSTGDIMISVADDLSCPDKWDKLLLERLHSSTFKIDDIFCFFVHDGIVHDPNTTQTHAFVSKGYYKRFGYLFYPEYISICADVDFTIVALKMGCIVKATDLLFEHRHYTVGKSTFDDTYARENGDAAMVRARTVFDRRTKEGFPI